MTEETKNLKITHEDYKKVLYQYLILLSVGINIVGAQLVNLLHLPAFLESIGTILSAILLGPILGATVGLFTNIMLGYLVDPYYFYFAIVNVLTGAITGYIFKNYPFNIRTVLIASIIISVVASLVGNSVAYFVFSGASGASVDILTSLLVSRGYDLFYAVYITGFFANMLDKLISFAIVFYMIGIGEKHFKISEFRIKWNN